MTDARGSFLARAKRKRPCRPMAGKGVRAAWPDWLASDYFQLFGLKRMPAQSW